MCIHTQKCPNLYTRQHTYTYIPTSCLRSLSPARLRSLSLAISSSVSCGILGGLFRVRALTNGRDHCLLLTHKSAPNCLATCDMLRDMTPSCVTWLIRVPWLFHATCKAQCYRTTVTWRTQIIDSLMWDITDSLMWDMTHWNNRLTRPVQCNVTWLMWHDARI